MKEFVNLVSVSLVGGDTAYEFLADTFSFQPSFADDEGGPVWDCSHTFIVDTPDDDALRTFARPRQAIVTLKDSDGLLYDIGTTDIPARVSIARHLQRCILTVDCRSLTDPLAARHA